MPPFPGAGEAAALANCLAWGTASVLFARAFRASSAADAVWFKNAVAAVVLGVLAAALGSGAWGGLPAPGESGWLALSGLLSVCIGDLLYFLAIAHVGVARTVIIAQTTPALTALLAWPLHGEALSGMQWAGVLAVVCGGTVAESRRLHGRPTDRRGFLLAAACACAWAAGNLTLHDGLHHTGPVTGGAVRLGAASLGLGLWFLWKRELGARVRALGSARLWRAYGLPTMIGAVGGMILFAAAFKWTQQGVAAALTSALPLFTVPLAVLLLGERPGARGWCGAVIVAGGAGLLGWGAL